MQLRYSISGLMAAVLLFAVSFALLRNVDGARAVLGPSAVLVLATAAGMAFNPRSDRITWAYFGLFGLTYLILVASTAGGQGPITLRQPNQQVLLTFPAFLVASIGFRLGRKGDRRAR